MKQKLYFASILFLVFVLYSCSSKSEKQEQENNSTKGHSSSNTDDNSTFENNSTENEEDDIKEESNVDETDEYLSGCKFEDGTYSATVNYSNPETGYSATYTLNIEVQDCQIVQINFPNDGYLDEDHISATDLDDDGSATVDGEDGKTYEIQINN